MHLAVLSINYLSRWSLEFCIDFKGWQLIWSIYCKHMNLIIHFSPSATQVFFAPFSFSVKYWHWDYSHCNILLSALRQQIATWSLAQHTSFSVKHWQWKILQDYTPTVHRIKKAQAFILLAQLATSWGKTSLYMPFVITATSWHICFRCARASLPPKYPWEVLPICHILYNHLLKHSWNIQPMLSHLTFIFTTLLHRDIRLGFTLNDLQVPIHWHTLYSQSPQMWPGNWPHQAAQLSVAQIVSALVHILHEIMAVQETTIWVYLGEHSTSILHFLEFSLQRHGLDLQLLHMICSWTHQPSFKCPTTLPGEFCSRSYFTYYPEF